MQRFLWTNRDITLCHMFSSCFGWLILKGMYMCNMKDKYQNDDPALWQTGHAQMWSAVVCVISGFEWCRLKKKNCALSCDVCFFLQDADKRTASKHNGFELLCQPAFLKGSSPYICRCSPSWLMVANTFWAIIQKEKLSRRHPGQLKDTLKVELSPSGKKKIAWLSKVKKWKWFQSLLWVWCDLRNIREEQRVTGTNSFQIINIWQTQSRAKNESFEDTVCMLSLDSTSFILTICSVTMTETVIKTV